MIHRKAFHAGVKSVFDPAMMLIITFAGALIIGVATGALPPF